MHTWRCVDDALRWRRGTGWLIRRVYWCHMWCLRRWIYWGYTGFLWRWVVWRHAWCLWSARGARAGRRHHYGLAHEPYLVSTGVSSPRIRPTPTFYRGTSILAWMTRSPVYEIGICVVSPHPCRWSDGLQSDPQLHRPYNETRKGLYIIAWDLTYWCERKSFILWLFPYCDVSWAICLKLIVSIATWGGQFDDGSDIVMV